MAKPYRLLREKMTPESRARSEARAQEILREMPCVHRALQTFPGTSIINKGKALCLSCETWLVDSDDAVAQAVQAERERCAVIVEGCVFHGKTSVATIRSANRALRKAAAALRRDVDGR